MICCFNNDNYSKNVVNIDTNVHLKICVLVYIHSNFHNNKGTDQDVKHMINYAVWFDLNF